MKSKYLLFVLVLVFAVSGCATNVKEIGKIDVSLEQILTDSKLSLDCKAGLANGFIIAPDSTAGTRAAAAALDSVATKGSDDYKKCFGQAAWIAFLIHGGKDLSDRILSQLATLGVVK